MRALWMVCWTGVFMSGLASAAVHEPSSRVPDAVIQPSVADYPSIQAAVDANPGSVVWVPPGDHVLKEAILIRHSGSGLVGPGRLVQSNASSPFIDIRKATGVRIVDLALARTDKQAVVRASAIVASECQYLTLKELNVSDNRSAAASIRIENSEHISVIRCSVRNYMAISIDDRTASPHYGYAFRCIDGTGIAISSCRDVLLQGNRIIEEKLRPTPETKERYQLGHFTKRSSVKGSLLDQGTWDDGYVNNWHQGSALIVTGPESTAHVRLLDNHIENAAQGIDIHADYVTVSGNFVVNSFMGMKAMHGSSHILIANNQFIRNDLWAIGMMPGTAAHGAVPSDGETPARKANVDGGSMIVNNIISDFGHGDSHWIWDPNRHTCAPIVLDHGQESDDPPLNAVVVTGNVVFNPVLSADSTNGLAVVPGPRYRFTVHISDRANGPRRLLFHNNLFQPGTDGICNVEWSGLAQAMGGEEK